MKSHKKTKRDRDRTCTRKRNYKTKEAAEADFGMVSVLNDSKGKSHKNKYLRAYQCPYCSHWHITTTPVRKEE